MAVSTNRSTIFRGALFLLFFIAILCQDSKSSCVRKQGVISRKCLKQCHSDSNCVSPRKRCICDGACGRSCINRNLRCESLRDIPNGKIMINPYNQFGAVARYKCDDDYRLVGSFIRVCQGDETWSNEEPKCVFDSSKVQKDCQSAPIIHNAHHDGGSNEIFKVGTRLRYSCNDGFVLSNDAPDVQAWCVGGHGVWVGPKIACTHAGCPIPPNIDFGSVDVLSPSVIGTKATYVCFKGYHLAGKAERVCLSSGEWDGVEPSCEFVTCDEPPKLENAYSDSPKDQKTFPSGFQIVYQCNFGYEPNIGRSQTSDPPRTMCDNDGKWTTPRSRCLPVNCGDPGEIKHGTRQGYRYTYPNSVLYQCHEGYDLIGRSTRLCQPNGSWSGSRPFCRAIICEKLKSPNHGYMNGTSFVYGSKLHFSCDKNYNIIGSATRECTANGLWNGQPAVCQEINCGLPSPIYNGYFEGHRTTVGEVIKFRCNLYATFHGEAFEAVCLRNGQWSHPTPHCWRQCRVLRIKNATTLSTAEWVDHDTVVTYECKNGLMLDSDQPIRCFNGTWSHAPQCNPVPCFRLPPRLNNGRLIFFGTKHGDIVKYSCLPGYKLTGGKYHTCNLGKWQGKRAYCKQIMCPNPGPISKGKVYKQGVGGIFIFEPYITTIRHGTRLVYKCDPGHEMVGPSGATCVDGSWRPMYKPRCKSTRHLRYYHPWSRLDS